MSVAARLMCFLLLVCGFGAVIMGDWAMVAELAAVPAVAFGGAYGLYRAAQHRPPPKRHRRG